MTTLTPPRRSKDQKRRSGRPASQALSPAARRAYAKRSVRFGETKPGQAPLARVVKQRASRIPFVALIIAMLVAGLALTLLLSTQAAQQAYQISEAKMHTKKLSETREALLRDVELGQSAPELARRAGELGMVPAPHQAYLVVAENGDVSVVGEPRAATGSPLPPFNTQPSRPDQSGPRSGSAERELEVAIPIPIDELPNPGQLPDIDREGQPSELLLPVGDPVAREDVLGQP